jgi:hypothetical protein
LIGQIFQLYYNLAFGNVHLDSPLTESELEFLFNFLQFIPSNFRFKALNVDISIFSMDLQINIQPVIEGNIVYINIKQGRTSYTALWDFRPDLSDSACGIAGCCRGTSIFELAFNKFCQ